MPPVLVSGSPSPAPAALGGHGGHAAGSTASTGQAFPSALAKAKGHTPGVSAHGGHRVANGGPAGSGHTAPASVPYNVSHPHHFRIGESNHGEQYSLQETALGVRAYRQQLIAANISNADTPGYQAVDIDFEEALRMARSMADMLPLGLSATTSGHISGPSRSFAPHYPLKYQAPSQASADGNTVEMDVERSKFAENSMMWEFARDRVSSHYKHMMEMLQNLKD